MNLHYPLRFQPVFQDYIWGGDRLVGQFRKNAKDLERVAESWEIVDHDAGQSVVLDGDLKGKSLRELMGEFGRELVGQAAFENLTGASVPATLSGRFPLLFKFLDAEKALSVQVHPDDKRAAMLDPPDLGKTEAWVVMAAEPGSQIYAGLKEGVTRADFEDAVARADTEAVLHSFEPQVGDCIMIPAGTVHAIGAGLMIAEIQQASNTTYRLHDWNRVDANGKSRELHVSAGLDAIDFSTGPVNACGNFRNGAETLEQQGSATTSPLVACEKFAMDSVTLPKANGTLDFAARPSCTIFAVVEGAVEIANDPVGEPLQAASTVLIPAGIPISVTPVSDSILLKITLPLDSEGQDH